MSKKISGAEHSLSEIFSPDFDYVIPPYQRPYAWTDDQASELFDDLYDFYASEDKEDTYFLGSIVLIKEEKKPHSEVIDGQQRLTTLTILLSLITSALSSDKLKNDFAGYIQEPGRPSLNLNSKPRLALRERDREFFAKYVQALEFDALFDLDNANLNNESQKNIQSNSRKLFDKLKKSFGNDDEKLLEFGKFLVMNCFLVVVSTPSQESAFRVFSVLNNRGLNLLPSDILKADVIGQIATAQDDFNEKWEELEVRTGREGFNDLLGHVRMIYARKKAKSTLLEEFKEHVQNKFATPEDLIEKCLEPYADSYLIAKSKQDYASIKNADDVNNLLKWLNYIDNSDWLPPAILFLSREKNHPEHVLCFFAKLERLAAYLHICAKNINQRIERYAKVIASLDNHADSVELSKDEIDEMRKALYGNIYEELTPRRRNYLILRLDSFLSDGVATYDKKSLTIEHVLPQTVSNGSEWEKLWTDPNERKNWVHRIANLVPLTQRLNSKARNFDFDKKKTAYFGGKQKVSSYVLTTQVLNTDTWTPSVVAQRQEYLFKVLVDGWKL